MVPLMRGSNRGCGQAGLITRLTPEAPLLRSASHVNFPIDSASQCGTGSGTTGSTDLSKHYVAKLQLKVDETVHPSAVAWREKPVLAPL